MALAIGASSAFRSMLNLKCGVPVFQKCPQIISNERLPQQLQQIRAMSKVKKRYTSQPFWQPVVERKLYPEYITPDNEEFLKEVVEYRYKQPSPLELEPWPRGEWEPKSQRCGLIGKKLGQYTMWRKNGKRMVTTIIHISDNHVIRYVPASELKKNEYSERPLIRLAKRPRGALIVGSDSADPRLFTKEYYNMFEKCGVMPKKKVAKFLVSDNAILQPGTPLYASHFRPGDNINVTGYSVDYSIQGVVKRWGFKGGPKTHGTTKNHRRPGYIGCGKTIVMPGKKMHGHMGMNLVTMRGMEVLRINTQYNCLWVNGPVPGAIGGYLSLHDSSLFHQRYKNPEDHPPFPTHYPAEQPLDHVD